VPLPRSVARLNRRFTNHLMAPLARVAPGFGILVHRGRHTGKTYRIPVNAFPCGEGFVFALTYGEGSDWVRNVLASHLAVLERRGEEMRLTHPRVVDGSEVVGCIPAPVGFVLRTIGVDRFLVMEPADGAVA
jgi:deazaflavin-dependent oxidoreductase (nitroreductase family)